MKIHKLFLPLLFFLIVAALVFPSDVQAAPLAKDQTVIGETYTLERNRILDGDLNVIGGVVAIEPNATVNGNVFALGSVVTIDGTIKGNLTAVGGTVNINQAAVIEGDLISPVSFVVIDPNAIILGEQREDLFLNGFSFEQIINARPILQQTVTPAYISTLIMIGNLLAMTLVMAGLGAFLFLILPKPADRMRFALMAAPWQVLGYGTLTTVAMTILSVFLIITICLIPVFILIGLTFLLAILVGWLALGYELGERISTSIFRTKWHPILSAAIGNTLLYLLARGITLIPCLGAFVVLITMLFALGMTVVTLFGTYPFPRIKNGDDGDEPIVLFEKEHAAIPEAIDAYPPEDEMDPSLSITSPASSDPQTTDLVIDPTIERPVEELLLSSRSTRLLKEAQLTTVESVMNQLAQGDETLLAISGFGEKSLQELKDALRESGYPIP